MLARRGFPPALVVLAVAIAAWLVSGVAGLDIVKFSGYEIGFVGLPGAAVLWALRRRRGILETVALGWPLGHALEILAFTGAAAAGARALFAFYPVLVVVPCAIVIWRRGRSAEPNGFLAEPTVISQWWVWSAACALTLGLVELALIYFPEVPLPTTSTHVAYSPDFPYFMGLIAQASNHWPMTSPGLYGSPLQYQMFVFYHMAGVSQITGVSIPVLALRLDYVPSILVIGCQLLLAGRVMGGSFSTGVTAVIVTFLLGTLDLTKDAGGTPFFHLFTSSLLDSWTFPLGLMFFLALLLLLADRLHGRALRIRDEPGFWVVLVLLMIGASGSKATVLPVFMTGLLLYAVFEFFQAKLLPRLVSATLGVGVVVFTATFLLEYGGTAPYTSFGPLASLKRTLPVEVVDTLSTSGFAHAVLVAIAYPLGLAGMLLPLAGILYLVRARHRGEVPGLSLCLAMLAAGLLIANAVHQVGYSELYFQDLGYVAACVIAAAGLRAAWLDLGTRLSVSRRAVALALGGWIVALVAVVAISTWDTPPLSQALLIRLIALSAACAVFVIVWRLLLRLHRKPTAGTWSLGLIPLLAASALTTPVRVAPTVGHLLAGSPVTSTLADPQQVRGLTPGLLAALRWLRDNSTSSAVFAVNNHWVDPAEMDGRYFYYSAFSERQVFIEGYDPIRYLISIASANPVGNEYEKRLKLNDAVFDHADLAALRVLTQQYRVQFLFIDRIHHNSDPATVSLGRVVYRDADATIVSVA